MSSVTTRWVFFIALLLFLPLPFYSDGFGSLPVVRVIFIVTAEGYLMLSGQASGAADDSLLLALQVIIWGLVLWLSVGAYITYTSNWPSKVRGSVMGLTVFSMLILLSTFAVYRSLEAGAQAVTFLQVYH